MAPGTGAPRAARSGEGRLLAVVLSLALGAPAALTACKRERTDAEQIRALLAEAAHAAEEKRVDGVMRAVSERFEGQGLDARGVKQLVAFHLLRGSWVAIELGGDEISVDGDAATAAVDVVMVRSGKGRALAELLPENATVHRFVLRLARAKGGWSVTTATWRPASLEEALAGPRSPSSR